MLFFCYFPLKNNSIEGLFSDFLKETNKKIAILCKPFLKGNKSIDKATKKVIVLQSCKIKNDCYKNSNRFITKGFQSISILALYYANSFIHNALIASLTIKQW